MKPLNKHHRKPVKTARNLVISPLKYSQDFNLMGFGQNQFDIASTCMNSIATLLHPF